MRISTHGAAFFLSGMLCRVPRVCVQTARTARHAAVLASSIPPNVGSPSSGDEAEFVADPAAFCMKRYRQIGPVFATGALGGAFFVGSSSAIDALASARTAAEPAELQGPFEGLEAGYDFSACGAVFNDELHAGLFEWIPLYKESGGFSSFRFEDFIDRRVRKLAPSLRRLLLRALLPVVVGVRWAEMPPEPAPEALLDAYEMHSAKLRGERAFGKELQSLIFGRNPDAAAQLGPALDKLAAGAGTRSLGGGPALPCLASAVEQITSLLCSMLLQAKRRVLLPARAASSRAGIAFRARPHMCAPPLPLRRTNAIRSGRRAWRKSRKPRCPGPNPRRRSRRICSRRCRCSMHSRARRCVCTRHPARRAVASLRTCASTASPCRRKQDSGGQDSVTPTRFSARLCDHHG